MNKVAYQSSTFEGLVASRANDGDPGTWMSTDEEKDPWWEVDIGNYYHVTIVEIFTRTDDLCLYDFNCRKWHV